MKPAKYSQSLALGVSMLAGSLIAAPVCADTTDEIMGSNNDDISAQLQAGGLGNNEGMSELANMIAEPTQNCPEWRGNDPLDPGQGLDNPGIEDNPGLDNPGLGLDNPGLNDTLAAPIPAAAWLFGSGLLGLGTLARRKRPAQN